jgi:hypothetical protein
LRFKAFQLDKRRVHVGPMRPQLFADDRMIVDDQHVLF